MGTSDLAYIKACPHTD